MSEHFFEELEEERRALEEMRVLADDENILVPYRPILESGPYQRLGQAKESLEQNQAPSEAAERCKALELSKQEADSQAKKAAIAMFYAKKEQGHV